MKYEYRQYQEDAVNGCLHCFEEQKNRSVMLESPVGSGKTLMALQIIHRLQEHLGRTLRVNWVAPRRHLLKQVMEANRELAQENIRPVSLFEKFPPTADFVVLDEAHHEATQSCVLLYEKMHHAWTLGLSATPLRTDRMKLSFQNTVNTCSIGRLMRDGYLSPYHSYLLPQYDVKTVAEAFLASPDRWGKSLVFFHTIRECNDFQEWLLDAGITCEVVTAESDKDRQLDLFVNGKCQVVANVSMLTEGFDQPDVHTIFARDASRLPTIQMCGRGLRRAPGKEQCNIVQSGNCPYLFEKVAPPANAFRMTNGKWLALKDGTEEINATLARSLELLTWREAKREKAAADQKLDAIVKSEFYQSFGYAYRELYRIWEMANHVCWDNQLPECAISLNRSELATKDMMTSTAKRVTINGRTYPGLTLNLQNCMDATAGMVARALLHESIHVYQRLQGNHASHTADFFKETTRLGLAENAPEAGSPAEEFTLEVERQFPSIADDLKAIQNSTIMQPRTGDLAFFTDYHNNSCQILTEQVNNGKITQ